MEGNISSQLIAMQKDTAVEELSNCNKLTEQYGISLTRNQIMNLVEHRFHALEETGRIEFGEGVLKMLIEEFCDSPYINQENFEEILTELQDSFYYFKNQCEDQIPDDELISFMLRHFNGICNGSLDYLNSTTLEELCRNTRYGYTYNEDSGFYGSQF